MVVYPPAISRLAVTQHTRHPDTSSTPLAIKMRLLSLRFLTALALPATVTAAHIEMCSRLLNVVNLFSAAECSHTQANWAMTTEMDPQWFQTMQASNGCQNILNDAKSIRVSYLDEKCSCEWPFLCPCEERLD